MGEEIPQAAIDLAIDLLKAEGQPQVREYVVGTYGCIALARFIAQVSDAAKGVDKVLATDGYPAEGTRRELAPFILVEPVEPLEAAASAVIEKHKALGADAEAIGGDRLFLHDLQQELAARGLKIVEQS